MELGKMLSLEGKVALITGAGSGIGKSTAKLFARAGAKVGLLGRDTQELEAASQRIAGETCILTANVAEPGEMSAAFDKLIDTFGRLDIVVANAGINGVWASLESLSPKNGMKRSPSIKPELS